jgi:glycerol uptake facilitator-like aquaporin
MTALAGVTTGRKVVAEIIGSALLLASIVGSGVMAERLSGGNVAIALLANSIATGATLVAIILTFGSMSGAHLNPVVTLAVASQGGLRWWVVPPYVMGQILGAFAGLISAHLMFSEAILSSSLKARASGGEVFSEFVATFGLLCIIWGCSRVRVDAIPYAVGLYITGAYWFTASTSFANPAVTLARSFTNTFSGIRAMDAPWFIAAQFGGAAAATLLFRWLLPSLPEHSRDVGVPYPRTEVTPHGR